MTDNLTRSLIVTKLQRPYVGQALVARPQLLARLDASQKLTLILAPAGYGKTTLLSTWLETCQLPYAWLALDEHDDDPAIFVAYLLHALDRLFPTAIDTTFAGVSGANLPPPDLIARDLLNDLAAIEQDFILVLDDYHVIRHQAIHDLVTSLLWHPPRALHLVIASRHDPPLPLANLRAWGHVTELRGADLRFTSEETRQFLVETMALTLDDSTISALTARTEGWPAGLRLTALALRQRLPLGLTADAPGDDGYVMDFLIAEVLSQLPISIQEFLVKTSILDQLCSPLCEAVTGMTDQLFGDQPILGWLEHTNLFLVSVDAQQRWYRCHQLFRQLLSDRLKQLHGPNEIAALHLRASTWFAANGYLDEALQHALAAHDVAAAVQIIVQHRHELMNQAQWQRLDRWVHLFPRKVIDEQPHMLLIEVWLKFIRQQFGEVPALLDRVEALLSQVPATQATQLQGEVESRRSALLYWAGDSARSITLAQRALEKVPFKWWYVRGFTRLFLSASSLMSGDLNQVYPTLYEPGEPDQGLTYRNQLLGEACLVHWIAADLASMAQAARQVVANTDPLDRAEMTTFSQYHVGLYHYQRNELAAAETYLLPLVRRPYGVHALCFLNSAVLLARIRQAQDQPAAALEIADAAASFALEMRSEVLATLARALRAELALRQGRLAEASQWAAQSGTFRRIPVPLIFAPPLLWAQILLAQATPASWQQASELLAEMNAYYSSSHHTTIQLQVLALQAILSSAEGNESQALAALSNSIALAEPGGFLRLFVDLGKPLKPLLQKLAQRGVSAPYIHEILAAFGSDEASSSTGQPLSTEPVPRPSGRTLLTNRELEVLELLARRYTDKEIAETLVISPNTVSSHIDHLSDKLGVRGRRTIVQVAKDQGLLA